MNGQLPIFSVALFISFTGMIICILFLASIYSRSVKHGMTPYCVFMVATVMVSFLILLISGSYAASAIMSEDIPAFGCGMLLFMFIFDILMNGIILNASNFMIFCQLMFHDEPSYKKVIITCMAPFFPLIIWISVFFSSKNTDNVVCFLDFSDHVKPGGIIAPIHISIVALTMLQVWIYKRTKAILYDPDRSLNNVENIDSHEREAGKANIKMIERNASTITLNVGTGNKSSHTNKSHSDAADNKSSGTGKLNSNTADNKSSNTDNKSSNTSKLNSSTNKSHNNTSESHSLPGQVEPSIKYSASAKMKKKESADVGRVTKYPGYLRTIRQTNILYTAPYYVKVIIFSILFYYNSEIPQILADVYYIITLVCIVVTPLIYSYGLSLFRYQKQQLRYICLFERRESMSKVSNSTSQASDNTGETINVDKAKEYEYNGIVLKNDKETGILVIDESTLTVGRILKYEIGKILAIECAKKLFCLEQLYFLIDIFEYKELAKNIEYLSPAWKKAAFINNTYLRPGDEMVANIQGTTRDATVSRFEQKNLTIQGNEYDDAVREVNSMLNDFSAPNGFLYLCTRGALFREFTKFMKNIVKENYMEEDEKVVEILKSGLLL